MDMRRATNRNDCGLAEFSKSEIRAEATVQKPIDGENTDLETIVAVIARSPIVVTDSVVMHRRLPFGYDEADVAILDWIAAEGRRAGQNFIRM